LLLWGNKGLTQGAVGDGPTILVISRALCQFRLFTPVGGGNTAKARAALALMIRNWVAYKDFEYISIEAGPSIMVWAWSRAKASEGLAQSNHKSGRVLQLPETLLSAKGPDGIRLVRCIDGFEAQNWKNGVLKDSRWWANAPSVSEWVSFQRAASAKPAEIRTEVPAPEDLVLLEKPWGGTGSSAFTVLGRISPAELGYALTFAACLPFVFLFGSYLRVSLDIRKIDGKLSALQSSVGPILEARERSFAELDRIKALLALDPYPQQIQLMARVASLIQINGTQLADWNYQRGDLDIGLQAPNGLDARDYVERFELAGPFKDVTVDRNNAQITFLRMKVKTLAESAQKAPIVPNNALPPAAAAPLPPTSPFGATDLPSPTLEGPPRSENPSIK
jgi:hypothetical protein